MDSDEERDYADQGPRSDSDLDGDTQILATLLKLIPGCIDAADIELLLQGIPVQPPVVIPARSMQEAIQAEDIPPLDVDAANVFSKTERIIQEHVRQHDINATVVKDLIQKVIHHRDFNANEVDHDMHQRLMRAVEDGDIEVIDVWEEGDGIQDVSFVKRKVAKVLMVLLALLKVKLPEPLRVTP
jgi:polyhydroxyalkanoate synthesis regulator phasin